MRRRSDRTPLLFAGVGLSLLLAGLLVGCQAEVEAELEVGDIVDRETRGLFATSQVRTEDCDRGTRSVEREGSAGWTTWVLSGVFPDTRYRACRESDSAGVTTFRNMIVFDAMPGAAFSGLSHVNLKLHERTLSVGLPAYVQGNIKRVRDQTGRDGNPEISTRLTLVNNEDQQMDYRLARYQDDGHVDWG